MDQSHHVPLRPRGPLRGAHLARPSTPAHRRRTCLIALQLLLALALLLQPAAAPAHAQEPPLPTPDAPALVDPASIQPDGARVDAVIPAANDATPPIVISEIYAKPPLDTDRHEFVELYNPLSTPVSLAYWTLSGGVDFAFPSSAVIPANGYVVVSENPGALRSRYGMPAALVYGPFSGNLAGDGERLTLRDANTVRVDEVTYADGFPWPVAGAVDGQSIQLINVALDNAQPGAWRAGGATPAAANAGSVSNPPPFVQSVTHTPKQPAPGENVTVSVVLNDADGIGAVSLLYQVVRPGAYIALNDAAYNSSWATVTLSKTGASADGLIYSAVLPAQASRTLVRYRVQASDAGGRSLTLPYPEDPQPNFAYFVYGALPAWWGTLRPGAAAADTVTFNFAAMRALPVYFFLAKAGDVTDAMHMPPSQAAPYMGSSYKWRGTLVYNGEVYDHVGFRPSGSLNRYATGKTNWRINFSTGHRFQAYDEYGRPFTVKRDKINLRGEMGHTDRERRGEHGMFEALSYRLFQLAGVPASDTNFVHWRVITGASEYGNSQYDGDFWGLYLSIEQPDEQFLEERNLPDGNLYKIESTAAVGYNYYEGDLENLGRNGPSNGADLYALSVNAQQPSTTAAGAAWWRNNADLAGYYSFRAITEFVHHYDMGEAKNYNFYFNPDTNKWTIFPWDLDLTWHEVTRYFGTGQEPWLCPLLRACNKTGYPWDPPIPGGPFAVEYQSRLRELRDLLLNPEQLFPMLDEEANWIDSPASTRTVHQSMVAADRFKWDYNPIYGASYGNPAAPDKYTDPEKSAAGQFYTCASGKREGGSCWTTGVFRGMVEGMKQYASVRFAWIDANLINDPAIPATPGIAYAGAANYPADQIRFATSAFADPQGAGTFAAMAWRIADVTPQTPPLYEITPIWESGALPAYQNTVEPPAGVVQPGRTYRARVRMMDNSGRWSHWSAPLQFTAAAPAAPVVQNLLLSEIMYNPLPWGNTTADDLEFIELTNKTNSTIALGGLRVTSGIEYTFPANSVLGPGKALVLAKDASAFRRRYGFNPFGAYDHELDNGSETISIVDAWNRSVLKVTYSDSAPWPTDADGKGYSLTYAAALGAPTNGAAWRRSLSIGGSPGGPEPVSILINEILLNPPVQRAVELYNPGELAVDVSHWFLSDSTVDARKVWLPAGSVIPPRGYLVIGYSQLIRPSFDGRLELDSPITGKLVLTSGSESGARTGYQMSVAFPALAAGVSFGRILDSLGREAWVLLARPTLGGENSGPRLGPLIISAVNYAPASGGVEYVELTNTSSQNVALYDAVHPEQAWQLFGGSLAIPAGITLPANGRLLAVSIPPEQACATLGSRGFVRIIGPITPLSNLGQSVAIVQPPATSGAALIVNDAVKYSALPPWPAQAAGQGAALRRTNLAGYGNDPAVWQPSADLPGVAAGAATATLCSFTALPNAQDGVTLTWAYTGAPLPTDVTGFKLYRSPDLDPAHAVEVASVDLATLAQSGDAVQAAAAQTFSVTDPSANPNAPAFYWLKSVRAGNLIDQGQTSLQRPYQFVYLPTAAR